MFIEYDLKLPEQPRRIGLINPNHIIHIMKEDFTRNKSVRLILSEDLIFFPCIDDRLLNDIYFAFKESILGNSSYFFEDIGFIKPIQLGLNPTKNEDN